MTIFSERTQIAHPPSWFLGLGAKKWETVGAFVAVQKTENLRREKRIKHDDDALIDFLDKKLCSYTWN